MKRKMKKNIIHSLAVLLMTAAVVSCSKEVTPEPDGAIRLDPKVGEGYNDTKASIFSDAELPETETFYVDAFLSDQSTVKPYFSSAAAHLYIYNDQDQIDEWRFCDLSSDSPAWKNYYFPLEGTVDFFAYVPQGYVIVSKTTNPPTFSAELPDLSDQTDEVKEFMYAYTPAMSKESPTVPLAFEHPFAAVRFEVGQAHRNLTIRTMGFKNINHKGSCALEYDEESDRYLPKWSNTTTGDMTITVNKIIPGDINFGGPVGETYIVMPQNLDAVKFVINYSWNNNDDDNSNDEYNIEVGLGGSWTAGKIYTYSLDLGNSAEEILFNVDVEQWVHTYDYTFELK